MKSRNQSFRKSSVPWIFYGLILFCGGCVGGPQPNTGIDGVYRIAEGIFRGPHPDTGLLQELKHLGIRTLVSFEQEGPAFSVEQKGAEILDLEFESIPLTVYEKPADEKALQFLARVTDPAAQPVYFHCDSGKDVTGAMTALYRVVVEDWPPKEAYNEAKKFGFWPYRGDAELKKFILQLNDHKERFRKTLGITLPEGEPA